MFFCDIFIMIFQNKYRIVSVYWDKPKKLFLTFF